MKLLTTTKDSLSIDYKKNITRLKRYNKYTLEVSLIDKYDKIYGKFYITTLDTRPPGAIGAG